MRMSSSVNPQALEVAASAAWALALIAAIVLAFCVAATSELPSTRLTKQERRVSLAQLPTRLVDENRAPLLPSRHKAWNRLVTEEDERRLCATIAHDRKARRLFWFAGGVSLLVAIAASLSAGQIYVVTGQTGILTRSDAVKFVGFFVTALCGWVSVPWVTSWIVSETGRSRLPLQWRLLKRVRTLCNRIDVSPKSWVAHERPRAGRITAARAEKLLRPVEDEILATLAPRGSRPSDAIRWRKVDAQRVSLLLDAKIAILSRPGREVTVESIYEWLDLVAATLDGKARHPNVLARMAVSPGLLQPEVRATAVKSLGLRGQRISGVLASMFLVVPLGIIVFGSLYPVARSLLTPYPDLLGAGGVMASLVVAQALAVVVARVSRRHQ